MIDAILKVGVARVMILFVSFYRPSLFSSATLVQNIERLWQLLISLKAWQCKTKSYYIFFKYFQKLFYLIPDQLKNLYINVTGEFNKNPQTLNNY